jgi:uncharacterized membrane protein
MPEIHTSVDASLLITWPVPLWLVLLASAACGLFGYWIYRHERGHSPNWLRYLMATIRCLLLLMVLWMLTGWSWLLTRSERPDLVLVVDVSDSMATPAGISTPDAVQTISRLDRVRQLLSVNPQQLNRLYERYQVRTYAVAQDVVLLPSSAGGEAHILPAADFSSGLNSQHSRLGDAINRVIDRQTGRSKAAIVLFSDGINTAGTTLADAGQRARRAGIPIHTVALGDQSVQPDLRVGNVLCEQQVFLGDRVTIEATVIASDVFNAQSKVQLIDVANGAVLDEISVLFNGSASQHEVSLGYVPEKPGQQSLRVVISRHATEKNTENNQWDFPLVVHDQVLRVLMVFAQPSYEFRFLKHFLERSQQRSQQTQAAFQLVSVLQTGDVDYVRQDQFANRLIPTDAKAIEQFDAFIFGPLDTQLIPGTTQQAIVEAVTGGGAGCLFVSGLYDFVNRLEDGPLGDLLPVVSAKPGSTGGEGFLLEPTSLGLSSLPMQWASTGSGGSIVTARLPWLQTILPITEIKPGAQVLAEAVSVDGKSRSPLLISQYAGSGRTALLATDETYRWTSVFGLDLYHQQFWGQSLRWLCRGRIGATNEALMTVEPKLAKLGTSVRIQLRLPSSGILPEQAVVSLVDLNDVVRNIPLPRTSEHPTLYQAHIDDLAAGRYRATLAQPLLAVPPTADFSVAADTTEQANLRTDVSALQRLAELSNGQTLVASKAQQWINGLPVGQPTRLGSLPTLPIWNRPWVAALFIMLITIEWLLRRYARML